MAKYNQDHLENAAENTVDFELIIAPALRKRLRNLDGKRVLDIGCGTGKYARLAATLNADVTAIDRGIEQINLAKLADFPEMNRIDYLVGDICTTKKVSENFDFVFLMFVVLDTESADNLILLAQATANALKPGGALLLADVHPHNFNRPNSVESVAPISEGDYFTEGCPISSKVLMLDGSQREFRPSFHYSLSFIVNTFCNEGLSLKNMSEPYYRETFPTHMLLEFTKPV